MLEGLKGSLYPGNDAGMSIERWHLHVAYLSAGSAFVGALASTAGALAHYRVRRHASYVTLEPAGDQLFLLLGTENPAASRLRSLGVDGTVLQAPTFVMPRGPRA